MGLKPSPYGTQIPFEEKDYKVVGTNPSVRPDATDKVTGKARYAADINLPGQLIGKVLRSPHAHARILSIDTSKAEALPGVKAVVTRDDFADMPILHAAAGEIMINFRDVTRTMMAREKVLFDGHPLAAVAATSETIAKKALKLIKVDYEVLPHVIDVVEAMKPDAPILHEDQFTKGIEPKPDKPSNIAMQLRSKIGDIDDGFKQADLIIEREFNTKAAHQGYIEPMNVTAHWNNDSRVHIWISTQGPFQIREETAKALDLRTSQIKVTPMEIGGGFGGKFPLYQEPVAVMLSQKSGKPVKIIMTRKEVFEGTGPTSGSYIKCKIGATKEGKIIAAEGYLAYEAGAYPGSPVEAGGKCMFACYDIPNVVVEGIDVVVNKPKTAAYRAPGATNSTLATETIVDEIAKKLSIDPIDFRLMNASKEGTRRADGPKFPKIGCTELLEAMKNHPHWNSPIDGENVGRGIAVGFWFNGGGPSNCSIGVNQDGTINLVEGSPDIGGSRASIAMQAAEVLSIDYKDVYPSVTHTDNLGYSGGTGGSRTTFATGWAAIEAARDVKQQMIARAAKIWGIKEQDIELKNGVFISNSDSELKLSFKELASMLIDTGGPITGKGNISPTGVGGSFAGNIVDIKLDDETGKIDIVRFTAFQDAGKAIHPSYVEGQMQGGSVQGIGWAINEEYFYDKDGDLKNPTFLDYRMPTTLDLPMIDTVIVEVANPGHPYGVRGVGETNIVPPPAAIANALYDVSGIRMNVLPMSPAVVMKSLLNDS